ncbi:UNVERIFIED_CONTAM: hypothetical protein K2H54_015182 [Gekko kuhli]
MELFSKEAILTSQSLALLLDKINAIDVKNKTLTLEKPKGKLDVLPFNKKQGLSSDLGPGSQDCNKRREIKLGSTPKLPSRVIKYPEKLTQDGMNKTHSLLASHNSNPHIRPRDEHSEAEEPHRWIPINCQEGAIYETELDLRSHQVISMPSEAPIKVKSLALELREAEAEQTRAQQFQLIPMDGMSKEMEGKMILPIPSVKGAQVPHNIAKTSSDILLHQGDEGAPLVSLHQEEMLDNSIEEEFFTVFADLTPQEQQAVTERLEHTKNCLLARKNHERSRQQVIQDDVTVNSNVHISIQSLLPPIDVEMDIEQSETGISAVNVDCPQTPKNGSVFFYRDRLLNQITESD